MGAAGSRLGPLLGVLAFYLFALISTGHLLAPVHAERIWGHEFRGPFVALWAASKDMLAALAGESPSRWSFEIGWVRELEFCALVGMVAAIIWCLRRLPVAYGMYILAFLAVDLSFAWPRTPLASFLRYVGLLFPVFLCMGATIRGRAARWVLVLEVLLCRALVGASATAAGSAESVTGAPGRRLPLAMPVADLPGLENALRGARPAGKPLLLDSRGYPAIASDWAPFARALAKKRAAGVITYDNRGSGLEHRHPGPLYRPPHGRRCPGPARSPAGSSEADVFGISMGGMIARSWRSGAPQRIDHLVLGCTHAGLAPGRAADEAAGQPGLRPCPTDDWESAYVHWHPSPSPEQVDPTAAGGLHRQEVGRPKDPAATPAAGRRAEPTIRRAGSATISSHRRWS